ncbi:hypothetical protein [Thermogemmatispora sp.]|nr:hypothetical protein [Thermogemmatispora sp.]
MSRLIEIGKEDDVRSGPELPGWVGALGSPTSWRRPARLKP